MVSATAPLASPSSSGPTARTRLLDAALTVIRQRGYADTTIDDLCAAAGVTKGSFFHHFRSKEDFAVAAAGHFAHRAQSVFANAPYHRHADPLDRLLGYVDFRIGMLRGRLFEFTCLLGTMVQEAYATHPAIREACGQHIADHATMVARDIAEARRRHAPRARWSAESLALHTQAVIQGSFVLAKARDDPAAAIASLEHLRRYLELLFDRPNAKESRR
jgi:TetR/AcrR family transcriptional repressor of nem operon